MSDNQISVTSHGDFLQSFARNVGESSSARLFAMQLELTPEDDEMSLLVVALNSLLGARKAGVDARIALDMQYAQNVTRVNNRDFPNWWPLLTKEERISRQERASITSQWLEKLVRVDAVDDISPRRQSATHATRARIIASGHIAQHWAVVHQKGAVLLGKTPDDASTTLTTGNLTTSDVEKMNNLAVEFKGERAHNMGKFVTRLIAPQAPLRSAGGHIWKNTPDDWVTLIHDYNNVGDPARLPFIHAAAEKLIDPERNEFVIDGELGVPQPEIIVYTSQYAPDGKLALMLDRAHSKGAIVVIPQQPKGDYRRTAFPYNIQAALSRINRVDSGLYLPARERPSHVKSLIVKYDNGTAAILFGSDNYLTHIQKFARNEELAVEMKIDPSSDEQRFAYSQFVREMHSTGEIDKEVFDKLMINN